MERCSVAMRAVRTLLTDQKPRNVSLLLSRARQDASWSHGAKHLTVTADLGSTWGITRGDIRRETPVRREAASQNPPVLQLHMYHEPGNFARMFVNSRRPISTCYRITRCWQSWRSLMLTMKSLLHRRDAKETLRTRF